MDGERSHFGRHSCLCGCAACCRICDVGTGSAWCMLGAAGFVMWYRNVVSHPLRWGKPCPPWSARAQTFQSSLISASRACAGRRNASIRQTQTSRGERRVLWVVGPEDWTGRPVPAPTSPHPRRTWLLKIAFPPPASSSMRCWFNGRAHLSGACPTASADLPAPLSASLQLARLTSAGGLPRAISPGLSPRIPSCARLLRPA